MKTLVSDKGVFEKLGDDEELTLTEYFPSLKSASPEQCVKEVKDSCGWELKVAPQVTEVLPPTFEELMTLRLLDPEGFFRSE